MNINKVLFESLKTMGVDFSFNDLDVNNDGQINKQDMDLTTTQDIKNAIKSALNSVDEENSVIQKESVSVQKKDASSGRQTTARTGLPITDSNTFANDVLNSKGTVYLYVGNQKGMGCSYESCEKVASQNLSELQKYANVYHLDFTNEKLVNELYSQLSDNYNYQSYFGCGNEKILKFVDGKLVEEIPQSKALKVENLIEKAEGTPSEMPDVAKAEDQNPDAPRNEYGVKTTNTQNFEKDVLNSKGTVYVTIGNLSTCCKCKELQDAIQQNGQLLNELATVYDLSTDTDRELCWQIYRDMGGGDGSQPMGLPQVAKFVDGKFVQLMPSSIATGTVSYMVKLAQGTAKKDSDGIAKTSAATFNDDVKKSKGTTYVMITSADGCQYCNYLHNQLKTMLPDVEESFGFYELATNQGADRDLCWQIYRDLGGGDGSQAMPLPQIAKFVDGEFVELLSNTRDFGTKGKNNASIKEMFEKAVGKPVNNITSNPDKVEETKATQEAEASEKTSSAKDTSDNSSLIAKKLVQNQLNTILMAKKIKEEEYDKLQDELEEKQKECEELSSKIKGDAEGVLSTTHRLELSSLQDSMDSIKSSMSSLEIEINALNAQYKVKSLSLGSLGSFD